MNHKKTLAGLVLAFIASAASAADAGPYYLKFQGNCNVIRLYYNPAAEAAYGVEQGCAASIGRKYLIDVENKLGGAIITAAGSAVPQMIAYSFANSATAVMQWDGVSLSQTLTGKYATLTDTPQSADQGVSLFQ